ncbi:MAG: septum formation inhibitor Maf [Gammaproteobacteria bacterium]|nr:septum formation inhibitor Maf [Gammaproteobacteria bacterium]
MNPELLLASRSPRRAELLRTLGVAFVVVDVEVDETPRSGESPPVYVERLARAKAEAGRAASGNALPVLAADTTVVCDEEILGKPADAADASRMLRRLSGRWHSVFTGVALAGAGLATVVVETRVCFRELTETEIAAYWASGEPADKAGAYGIQGLGGALVARIEGGWSNVVGLPLAETLTLLGREGIPHALSAR